MKILIVHNQYRQRGGEDAVVDSESAMLQQAGHQVELFLRHNDDIEDGLSPKLAVQTIWSFGVGARLRPVLEQFRPDVVHVHNTTPLISPSVYWTVARYGIPVVQTLHNFRLLCPQAMLLRNGSVCEDCLGHLPWRSVVHQCYRDSATQSAVIFGMLAVHRQIGTWTHKVTRYIALNEFCRRKFIEGGLPADRIVVKPNFVDLPAPPVSERGGFLFVGRLSREKGVAVLAQAAAELPDVAVRVAGQGDEGPRLDGLANVKALGWLNETGIRDEMRAASALVLPSLWYENFPRTLVEAFANGLPVIASRIGALGELVQDGVTGLLFEPGNAADLAAKIRWAQDNPQRMLQMGQAARRHYECNYTAEHNCRQLVSVYSDAIAEVAAQRGLKA